MTGTRMISRLVMMIACISAMVASSNRALGDDASELQIVVWNVESGGADVRTIASRVAGFEGVDLWGFSEVQNESWVDLFSKAAAQGENSGFLSVTGSTGGADRLAIVYDDGELELLGSEELHDINYQNRVRSPLVGHFRIRATGAEFLFCVNHLYRSRAEQRHIQATKLNHWGRQQELPVIVGGDMNFDWSIQDNGRTRDAGFDNMIRDDVFRWLRPSTIIKTQASERYNSILDMLFVTTDVEGWDEAECTIVVSRGDFENRDAEPDHRPVAMRYNVSRLAVVTSGKGGSTEPGTPALRDDDEGDAGDESGENDEAGSEVVRLREHLKQLESSIRFLSDWIAELDADDMRVASDRGRLTQRLRRMRMDAEAVRTMIERQINGG